MWTGGQVVDGEPRMMFALTHMRRIHGTRIVCDVNRTTRWARQDEGGSANQREAETRRWGCLDVNLSSVICSPQENGEGMMKYEVEDIRLDAERSAPVAGIYNLTQLTLR